MPDNQMKPDNARASPELSDAQRLEDLADPVRSRRARLIRIKLATLNIGTLTAKSREIADMMTRRKLDILCLQETRWTGGKSGGKARFIGDGIKLYYSGGTRPRNGVAICLQEEWQDKVIDVTRKSDRIIAIKLVTTNRTYNIVSVYAPQQGCEEQEKDRFWTELGAVCDGVPDSEELIVAGDLNGHVGVDRGGFERWHGGKSRGNTNAEGDRILNFVREGDLALVNTFFTKTDAQTYTFKSGQNQTVIDYIAVRRGRLGKVKDCKVIPGESVATQHRLMVVDFRIVKRKRKRRQREKRICWWKLRKEEGQQLVQKLTEKLEEIEDSENYDWEQTFPMVVNTAREVLGESAPGKYLEKESWWWNEEVTESVAEKKRAWKEWKLSGSEEAREIYRNRNKTSKEKCASARDEAYENLYKELDDNGPQKIYRLAKTRQRRSKDIDILPFVRNEDGKILSNEEDVKRRWRNYFDNLLNTENPRDELAEAEQIQGPIEEISTSEVEHQLERMKNNKATGPDELPIDLVKLLKDNGITWITECLKKIVKDGLPQEWRKSTIAPIYKQKGDPLACGNYRGIKLLSHCLKLLERVIEARLRTIVTIKQNQFGFQKGRSTTEPMFCLRILQEKFREFHKDLHMVFVDLEKAYDTIPRELIWYCLRRRGVPEAYISIVKEMYEGCSTTVRTTAGNTEEIDIKVGLHQGSALSPLLFIIVMDVITEQIKEDTPWAMLFADDLVLCDGRREDLEARLEIWREKMESVGLKISRSKTEYLPPEGENGNIRMKKYKSEELEALPRCTQFKYLGTTIHQEGGCRKEVELRISKAWNKWRELSGVLCDRKMPRRLKILIYKTAIRPALLYGNETLPMTGTQADKFSSCEMRMIRYCMGISLEEHRRNEDITREVRVMPIKDVMRKRRLEWFGHVRRREEKEDIRRVSEMRIEGSRGRGRPKQRWLDTVKNDLRWLDLDPDDTSDRMRWRSLVELGVRQKPATRSGNSGER
jgi:exonuclease III